jgi:hypothetical protein
VLCSALCGAGVRVERLLRELEDRYGVLPGDRGEIGEECVERVAARRLAAVGALPLLEVTP